MAVTLTVSLKWTDYSMDVRSFVLAYFYSIVIYDHNRLMFTGVRYSNF